MQLWRARGSQFTKDKDQPLPAADNAGDKPTPPPVDDNNAGDRHEEKPSQSTSFAAADEHVVSSMSGIQIRKNAAPMFVYNGTFANFKKRREKIEVGRFISTVTFESTCRR
jgi:hypothetical protein